MVDLVRSGRTPEPLSREFEPTAQAIWNWARQADRDDGRRQDGPTSVEREELTRLRRENRQLRQDPAAGRNDRVHKRLLPARANCRDRGAAGLADAQPAG